MLDDEKLARYSLEARPPEQQRPKAVRELLGQSLLLGAIALIAPLSGYAQVSAAAPRETRVSCGPGNPPADAMRFKYGEFFEVHYFPPDLEPDKTGCVWVRIRMENVVSEYFHRQERGEVTFFRMASPRPPGVSVVTECTYTSGKLTERKIEPAGSADAPRCPSQSELGSVLPQRYRADAIEGWVVDAETGKPLEGVIIVANWELKFHFMHSSSVGELQILETVTDANGRYLFPAWGPKLIPLITTLDAARLTLFKPGYRALGVFSPYDKSAATSTFYYDKKTFKLERFQGTPTQYTNDLQSLNDTLRRIGHDVGVHGSNLGLEGYCGWKSFPLMLRALDGVESQIRAAGVRESTFISFLKANDKFLKKAGCGTFHDVLEGANR